MWVFQSGSVCVPVCVGGGLSLGFRARRILSVWGRLYLSSRDSGFTVCLPVPDDRVWMAKCVPISEMEALGVSLCVSW